MRVFKAKKSTFLIDTGHIYYVGESDFLGHCYHIFANNYSDGHICNYFSDAEFNEMFEEVKNV